MAAIIALLGGMAYLVMLGDSMSQKAEMEQEAAKPELTITPEAAQAPRRRRRRVYVDHYA